MVKKFNGSGTDPNIGGHSAVAFITFQSLADRFLDHKRLRRKAATLKSYSESIARLNSTLGPVHAVRIGVKEIDGFVAAELGRGQSRSSVNVKLRVLKAVLRFGEIPTRVELLRVPRIRAVKILRTEEIGRLLQLCDERERVLFSVLASTALRIDEALHLRWGDVDFEAEMIRVTPKQDVGWSPKSHAEREVYPSPAVLTVLADYRRKQPCSASGDWIFCSRSGRSGQRLTTVSGLARKLLVSAGLYQRGKLFHSFRRAAASAMLLNGTDLRTVQEILGHASVTTTELYTFSNVEAKRAAGRRGLV